MSLPEAWAEYYACYGAYSLYDALSDYNYSIQEQLEEFHWFYDMMTIQEELRFLRFFEDFRYLE